MPSFTSRSHQSCEMPPKKKKKPGNKNSKGRATNVNIEGMTHEEFMAYKNAKKKISSKR